MHPVLRRFLRWDPVPLAIRRRIARLVVPFSDTEFSIDIDGVAYRGRLDNYLEWVVWVTGRYYESPYIELIRSLGLGGCAVDVGANVGNHALAFSTMFDEVIAFEPFEPLFRRLESKLAGRENVRLHNIALGAATETAGFAAPTGRNLGTGRLAAGGGHEIAVHRGDEVLRGRHSKPIRFIKIDVEGHEDEVLAGLAGTLRERRPVVFYEAFRTDGLPRASALAASFRRFPPGYEFWGLRGQTTFPLQRRIARPVRLRPGNLWRRCTYVLACPRELGLRPGSSPAAGSIRNA